MTIVLERIREGDWKAVERLVEALELLTLDTGGLTVGIRFGESSVTFTASNLSSFATIAHGLGRPPAAVFLCPKGNTGHVIYSHYTSDADSLEVTAHYPAGPLTQTSLFYWVVIG